MSSVNMKRVLITGAAGFINGYLIPELLNAGHEVVGIDDFSKYGPVSRSYDDHPGYRFVEGDAKDVRLLTELAADDMVDHTQPHLRGAAALDAHFPTADRELKSVLVHDLHP